MSLIISSINWNYKPYDLPALFGQYDPRLCNYRKTRGSRRLARETFGILLSWKRSRSPRHNNFFTDYRDIKFKLTAHRLHSENRNTVLWNKNYRNTAPKITQYRNTANPYAPLRSSWNQHFFVKLALNFQQYLFQFFCALNIACYLSWKKKFKKTHVSKPNTIFGLLFFVNASG